MNSTQLPFPWGTEDLFVQNKSVTVKILHVKRGEAPSLQYHHKRDEFWKILYGNPDIVVGDNLVKGKMGDEFNIPALCKHRILAVVDDVEVLEISTGDFDEADIVRLEDKYNRKQ